MDADNVVWTQSALQQLAETWLEADDPSDITSAAHAIDRELSDDPRAKGSEVSEGLRALVVHPLRVLFSVAEDEKVQVAGVRVLKS